MSEHVDRFTLDAYVEQALSAAERRTVEAHITTCPACQARLSAAKQLPALLYDLPRERPALNLSAGINAAIAARQTRKSARWRQAVVPAMFALGLVLLILAVPQLSRGLQTLLGAPYNGAPFPAWETVLTQLGQWLSEPDAALNSAMTLIEQLTTSPGEEMDVVFTLAIVVFAVASLGGLAQLLGGEQTLTAKKARA